MTTVEDIEKAVAKKQLAKFRAWFDEFQAQSFDAQIERDAKAGKLDKLADEALRAHPEARSREL